MKLLNCCLASNGKTTKTRPAASISTRRFEALNTMTTLLHICISYCTSASVIHKELSNRPPYTSPDSFSKALNSVSPGPESCLPFHFTIGTQKSIYIYTWSLGPSNTPSLHTSATAPLHVKAVRRIWMIANLTSHAVELILPDLAIERRNIRKKGAL